MSITAPKDNGGNPRAVGAAAYLGDNLVALSYRGSTWIYIYHIGQGTKHVNTLVNHRKEVVAFEHLSADAFVSIDVEGLIYTWELPTLKRLGILNLRYYDRACVHLTKLNNSRFAVGLCKRRLLIISHDAGHELQPMRDMGNAKFIVPEEGDIPMDGSWANRVYGLCEIGDRRLAFSNGASIEIHEFLSGEKQTTITTPDHVKYCTANAWFLVSASTKGLIEVRNNDGAEYPAVSSFNLFSHIPDATLPEFSIKVISLVQSHLLMASTRCHGIFFFSLPTMEIIATIEAQAIEPMDQKSNLHTCVYLPDGRIFVAGRAFCKTLQAEPRVERFVQQIQRQNSTNLVKEENKVPDLDLDIEEDVRSISNGNFSDDDDTPPHTPIIRGPFPATRGVIYPRYASGRDSGREHLAKYTPSPDAVLDPPSQTSAVSIAPSTAGLNPPLEPPARLSPPVSESVSDSGEESITVTNPRKRLCPLERLENARKTVKHLTENEGTPEQPIRHRRQRLEAAKELVVQLEELVNERGLEDTDHASPSSEH